MARFSEYLDDYPSVLPGDIQKPDLSDFESSGDRSKLFERFLALQQDPSGMMLANVKLPNRFLQFMSLGG